LRWGESSLLRNASAAAMEIGGRKARFQPISLVVGCKIRN